MPECHLMTDREWDQFWLRQDAMRKPRRDEGAIHRSFDSEVTAVLSDDEIAVKDDSDEPMVVDEDDDVASGGEWLEPDEGRSSASLLAAARSYAHRTAPRTNRCGACEACRAPDCGHCKECLDKPKFGGSGIRKKACISRVCTNASLLNQGQPSSSLSPPHMQPQPPPVHAQLLPPEYHQHLAQDYQQHLYCSSPATTHGYMHQVRRQPLTLLDLHQPASAPNLGPFNPDGTCRGALNILSASAVLAHQTPPTG
jgi:hypothetical protein